MDYIKYGILGTIQGITEPIPVSSSGHISLFKDIFNTDLFNSINFEIIANFGSFIAIFIIFRKDIFDLIINFFNYLFNKEKRKEDVVKNKFRYSMYIVISTIPVIITGLLLNNILNYSSKILAIMFLITAAMLFIVRKINGAKDDFDITLKDAIVIGLFQSVAILPGISRSGAVLVACLLCKLKKENALKYTFLLYFPVSVGSMILGASDLLTSNESSLLLPYLFGAIFSFVFTYISYIWLSNWVKKGKLYYFSIYCILLALFIFYFFR